MRRVPKRSAQRGLKSDARKSPPAAGSIATPDCSGVSPWTSCRNCGRKNITPMSAPYTRATVMIATVKTRLPKSSMGSRGLGARRSHHTKAVRKTTAVIVDVIVTEVMP